MHEGERFNAVTHLAGAVLTLVGAVVLVTPPFLRGDLTKAFGFSVYCATLFLAFLASTLYHTVRGDRRDLLRRFDRIAIYLLIAGTYTPISLVHLPGSIGAPLLAAVWLLALTGSAVEWMLARRKRPLSIALYVFMGWMGALTLKPLLATLGPGAVVGLAVGGLIYTLGALVLHTKISPRHHEVWHVAVLAGGACHFAVMLFYV